VVEVVEKGGNKYRQCLEGVIVENVSLVVIIVCLIGLTVIGLTVVGLVELLVVGLFVVGLLLVVFVVGLLLVGLLLVVPVSWLGVGVWLVDHMKLGWFDTDLQWLVVSGGVTVVRSLELVRNGNNGFWEAFVLEVNIGFESSGLQLELSGHVHLLQGRAGLSLSNLGISENVVLGGFLNVDVKFVASGLLFVGRVTLGDGFTDDVEGLVFGQEGGGLVSSSTNGDTEETVLHGLGESSLNQDLEGVPGFLGVNLVLNLWNG